MTHEDYMREALVLADEAAACGEAPIGCIIVKNGEIVGRGRNRRETDKSATAHAEIIAIDDACRKLGGWRLFGCDLYVTLEPCPMCAGAIINSRIDRVIFGADDAKAGSCGSVINLFELPYNHKPELISGVLTNLCSERLSKFFKNLRKNK
ncbi:MAG: tRNA adenosine(34) deaminase TadA [Clostridia bacterium]